ncbi:ComEC/Rec2 family competence protein [Arcanobacterium haemolyticum]|nr:ComEC/Rec2 family competence protein [Arcanobacterium haemolyticum]
MSKKHAHDMRLVPLACASLGGACLGTSVALKPGHVTIMVGASIALLAGLAWLRRPGALVMVLLVVATFSGIAGLAALRISLAVPVELVEAARSRAHVELDGVIEGKASRMSGSNAQQCRVDVRVSHLTARRPLPWSSLTRLNVVGVPCEVKMGQAVHVEGYLGPASPGQIAPKLRPRRMTVSGRGSLSGQIIYQIERSFADQVDDVPDHARGLLPGVVLGDDSEVPEGLESAMKTVSLTHLMAVSGGHLSLITGVCIVLIGRRHSRTTAIAAGTIAGGLVALVGPEPSVIRALGMNIVVLLGVALRRPSNAMTSLSLAIVGVAVVDPWVVSSLGFHLSVAATAGIVLGGRPLADRLSRVLPPIAADLIAIPLTAQVACSPVLMAITQASSAWSVFANAAVAPVIAPLTFLGLCGAVLSPLWESGAHVCVQLSSFLTWWIDVVARTVARWPGSNLPQVMVTVLLIASVFLAWHANIRVMSIVGVISIVIIAMGRTAAEIPHDWVIIQCDVGQGSASLVRLHGKTIMIDVGPDDGASSCLAHAGVERIDLLVLSHEHADHVGGLQAVLDEVDVEEVWRSPARIPRENAGIVDRQLQQVGISWKNVERSPHGEVLDARTGERVAVPPGLAMLWPIEGHTMLSDPNAASIVVHLDTAGGVLVAGDIGENEQRRLRNSLEPTNIVVVPHHGSSDQSESFARALQPSVALISVGENSYGHPSQRARDTYASARILDTQTCGTISITESGAVVSRCRDRHEPKGQDGRETASRTRLGYVGIGTGHSYQRCRGGHWRLGRRTPHRACTASPSGNRSLENRCENIPEWPPRFASWPVVVR